MSKNNFKAEIPTDLLSKIIKDPKVRTRITRESHLLFFHVYFPHYVTYEIAPFHKEIFAISEDEAALFVAITAFRGSGKTTLETLSYPIWSILGKQEKKFIVIISQTQEQARQLLKNIKIELETNSLLRADLGPFKEDQWNANSIVLTKYNARVMVASSETSIRGIKHGAYRPDLIILDDVEDNNSVSTAEGRDKTYEWFTSEIIPLGDKSTKIIIVGNLLHEDSLLMRLKREILNNERTGIYREYPLIDENEHITWPGKYPNMESVEEERKKIGDSFSWHREYLLQIIDKLEAIIKKEWIQFYRTIPVPLRDETHFYTIGVDLAISQKQSADFTALVSVKVIGSGDKRMIYILPNPINEKITFPQIIQKISYLTGSLGGKSAALVLIEEVMLQGYLTQQLHDQNYRVEGVKLYGMDKRSRLIMATNLLQQGKILFPEQGCEGLIRQLLGFGTEKHDDLVDALTLIILYLIDYKDKGGQISSITIKYPLTVRQKMTRSHGDWGRFIDNEDKELYRRPSRLVRC